MIVVFHPGIQHSHQLSWALNEVKLLRLYISGVPISNGKEKSFSEWFSLHSRFAKIPVNKKFHFIIFSIIRKIIGKVFGFKAEQKVTLIFDMLFDIILSFYVKSKKPMIVIGYENASYFTFKQVKKYSGYCILDAASMHYSVIPNKKKSLIGTLAEKRKSSEQRIADLIFCCSDFAKDSYKFAGINEHKLRSLPLGVSPPTHKLNTYIELNSNNELKIIYAGTISYSKGVDLVISAIKYCIEVCKCKILLTLVGRVLDKELFNTLSGYDWITHINYVDQSELFEIMTKNDVSILFSRNDSFGMVVAEAMSCACPVIVSTCVGAKEIIERYPNAGWIVELDDKKLAKCIGLICADRKSLVERKIAAVEASKAYTWNQYRTRVQSSIHSYLKLWNQI